MHAVQGQSTYQLVVQVEKQIIDQTEHIKNYLKNNVGKPTNTHENKTKLKQTMQIENRCSQPTEQRQCMAKIGQ